MRKNSNLQKFPHVPKSNAEKESYINRVRGGFDETQEDSNPQDFSETTRESGTPKSSGRLTPEQKPPYRSLRTTLSEFFKNYGLPASITIPIAIGGWMAITLIQQGDQLASLKPVVDQTVSDITDLQNKYATLNNTTIQSSALISDMQSDLTLLKSHLLGK